MKKALFVMVLFMAALVVNAQTTTTTNAKSTKVSVKVSELQKPITDNIAKDYVGFTIKEAFSVTLSGNVTYEVVITKGTTTETLVYDNNGVFVKKLAPKPAMAPKKK